MIRPHGIRKLPWRGDYALFASLRFSRFNFSRTLAEKAGFRGIPFGTLPWSWGGAEVDVVVSRRDPSLHVTQPENRTRGSSRDLTDSPLLDEHGAPVVHRGVPPRIKMLRGECVLEE
eukprot:RCo015436